MRKLGAFSMCILFTVMSFAGMVAVSDRPAPAPAPPEEKWGNIDIDQDDEQLAIVINLGTGIEPNAYIRLYDYDAATGRFAHAWSASALGGCVIGDVDNDGSKELVASSTVITKEGKGKNAVSTLKRYLHIWEDGDHSNSSSYKLELPTSSTYIDKMAIGDVDRDGSHELVILNYTVEVWDFTNTNGKVDTGVTKPTTVITDPAAENQHVGVYGLEVADSDNDGYDEILVGEADGSSPRSKAAVVDYLSENGKWVYKVVAYIGSSATDDITVADLDGNPDNGNEIFMSGYTGGKVFVWRHVNGQYSQIWIANFNSTTYDAGMPLLQANDAADIDKDGDLEIVSGTIIGFVGKGPAAVMHSRIYIWEYAGSDSWTEYNNELEGSHGRAIDTLAHADLDDDGDDEVVYDGHLFSYGKDEDGHPMLSCAQELPFGGANPDLDIG